MFRHLLKSKIHRARVTHCELHYEGSCAIDEDLLDASDIRENEQVHIWNVSNGERLITYAIRAERGSGIVSLNGSAARRASVGDLVIIAAFGMVSDSQPETSPPRLVFVDEHNRPIELRRRVALQTAVLLQDTEPE
jgi:aspartate 1-decarboxylase